MIKLNDISQTFRSVIILNGDIPDKKFFLRHGTLPIIATDGAANSLLDIGITPNIIIGDLDSLAKIKIPASIEILHITDQDTTDLQKCLAMVSQRNLFPCIIYGATGKESDHMLYNLNVINQYAAQHVILFHDSAYKQAEKYGIFVFSKLCGTLPIGTTISLLSLTTATVSTTGMRWELNGALLSPTNASVRNQLAAEAFTISTHSGSVLVLVDYYPIDGRLDDLALGS
jgi:thiamine pyrophosphokinase